METNFSFAPESRGEVVVDKGANAIQPLIAIVWIEIREGATDIELLVSALARWYNLGPTQRREKEESGE
jgi:hypothetical protein